MTLYEMCEGLFCHYSHLVVRPPDRLVLDNGWELTRADEADSFYGLFKWGDRGGQGSFVFSDGAFVQHGSITEEDFGEVVRTAVPVLETRPWLQRLRERVWS